MRSKTTQNFFDGGYPSIYYRRLEKRIVETPVVFSASIIAGAETTATPELIVPVKITTQEKKMSFELNDKQKALLLSAGRWLLSTAIAALAAWVAGPDGLELLGTQGQAIAVLVVGALVQSVNRGRRYGDKPGEDADEKVLTLNKG